MKKQIIVADAIYKALLFKYKSKHPDDFFKIVTPNDFVSLISFSYKKDPIVYLMSEGYSYSESKEISKILRIADVNKSDGLRKLYDELSQKDFISYDKYGKYEAVNSDILFLELEDDFELHNLAKRNQIKIKDITLEDLDLEIRFDERKEECPQLLFFKNKFQQFSYIFSDIRKKIINGEEADSFKIHIKDEGDLYYVSLFSDIFHLDSCILASRRYASNPKVASKLRTIYSSKDFSFSLEESNDESLKPLKETIEHYHLEDFPFDFAYSSLQEIIATLGETEALSKTGIRIFNDFMIEDDTNVYVTDFVDGSFYKVFDDNGFFSDEILLKIGANPSYIKTKIDRKKKLNYIRYSNIVFLSRVGEHLSDKIYSSQFVKEFECYGGEKENKYLKPTFNENGLYTNEFVSLWKIKELDDAFYRKPYDEFRSYDHSFKGISGYESPLNYKGLSVTKLEQFVNCPFSFYLSYLIPSKQDDIHYPALGTFSHSIFEHLYDEDFDFSKIATEAIGVYKEQIKSAGIEYNDLYEMYLQSSLKAMEKVCAELRYFVKYSSIKKTYAEMPIEWDLASEGEIYHFRGKIDKVLLVGKESGPFFYYLIDYKTGYETFDLKSVFLGKSTQLPLYSYALAKKAEEKGLGDASFAGFGIQNIPLSNTKKAFLKKVPTLSEKSFFENTAFKGVVLDGNHEDFWHLFDDSAFEVDKKDDKKLVLKKKGGYFLAKQGTFDTLDSSLLDDKYEPYSYNQMIEDAIEVTVSTIKKIENAKFDIAPAYANLSSKGGSNGLNCQYCPYKDVCYHDKLLDTKIYADEIKRKFPKKEG